MPIKCESCRFMHLQLAVLEKNNSVYCSNDLCATEELREMFPGRKGMPLDLAREICDREGDGIFVYFEPKEPSAGAAFAGESRAEFERDRMGQTGHDNAKAMSAEPTSLVQITRSRPQALKAATAGGLS